MVKEQLPTIDFQKTVTASYFRGSTNLLGISMEINGSNHYIKSDGALPYFLLISV